MKNPIAVRLVRRKNQFVMRHLKDGINFKLTEVKRNSRAACTSLLLLCNLHALEVETKVTKTFLTNGIAWVSIALNFISTKQIRRRNL